MNTVANLKVGQVFSLYGEEDHPRNIFTCTGPVKMVGPYAQVPVKERNLPFQALATSTVKFWKKA